VPETFYTSDVKTLLTPFSVNLNLNLNPSLSLSLNLNLKELNSTGGGKIARKTQRSEEMLAFVFVRNGNLDPWDANVPSVHIF